MVSSKPGRNERCPCGSGRKYEKGCSVKTAQVQCGPDLEPLYAEALHANNQGQNERAEQLCRQILSIDPDQADTLHLLAIVSLETERYQQALELVRRAISLHPEIASFHN